jgi:hypothetical protein
MPERRQRFPDLVAHPPLYMDGVVHTGTTRPRPVGAYPTAAGLDAVGANATAVGWRRVRYLEVPTACWPTAAQTN